MSLGFVGMTGMALLPKLSFASSLGMNLFEPQVPAFLVIDLAGGAGLSGNFLVGNAGGSEDLLSSYDQLGWDPRKGFDKRFGLPMAPASTSKIFEGITTTASQKAQAQFKMGSILHSAIDDTSGNPSSALWLASKHQSGFKRMLSQGLGQTSSQSGGNSQAALADSNYRPVTVNSIDDFLKNLTLGEKVSSLDPTRRGFLFDKIAKITKNHASQLSSENRDAFLGSFDSSLKGMKSFSSINTKDLDPRSNSLTQKLYGINELSSSRDSKVIAAAITLNLILGNTGPSVITIGGCDYHDGTSTTGDIKDLEIGQTIGRAVELAHAYKKPLFIQVITDGGVYSISGSRNWQGDSGSKSMSVMGLYNPVSVPVYQNGTTQVGHYTNGQGVERSTFIGDSPALAASAAFLNYLNACGKIGDIEKYIPRGTFSNDELKELLLFAPMGA